MKKLLFFFTLMLILSACGSTPSTPTPTAAPTEVILPVLGVDSQHMRKPDIAYEIPAGPGFILDSSTYDFGVATSPNAVQVVLDGRFYQTVWLEGAMRMPIFAADLAPVNGGRGLTEFPSGKQMIIAIGVLSEKGDFDPMWVAVVNVK
jgi:hypothetical protein